MIWALWLACAAPVDPAVQDTAPAWCDTAPPVDWHTFAQGFFLTHCQGCHATDTPDRFGAPSDVVFDQEADVLGQREAVRRTVLEWESMPPAGGLTEQERARLRDWLSCGS